MIHLIFNIHKLHIIKNIEIVFGRIVDELKELPSLIYTLDQYLSDRDLDKTIMNKETMLNLTGGIESAYYKFIYQVVK